MRFLSSAFTRVALALAAAAQGPPPPVFSQRPSARPLALPFGEQAAVSRRSGDRLLKTGDLRSAAREYDRAVRFAPSDPLLRLSAGVALAAIRDVNAAAAHFRQAWSLAEDDVIAALLLQGALSEQGKTAEAQRLLHDTVRRFGRAQTKGLDASGSIRRLTQAARRFPDSAIVHLLLGDAYQVAEQWEPAGRAYRQAVNLAPQWAKPRVNLGVLLLTQGRADDALKQFEAALAREPKNAQVRLHQGDALVRMGRDRDALQTLRKVGGSREAAADAETRIGQIHLQNNQTAAAIRSFLRAKSLAPRDPGPAAGYAEAQVRAGNYDEGAEAYRSALRLAEAGGLLSTRPILYRGLAESQLSARKPDAALRTLERALQDEPQAAPLWHRLRGEAYFSQRNAQAAEAALRQGLDSEIGQYPIDILNAMAARNLLVRVTAAYTAELGIPARRAPALVALAHLAQYEGDLSKEVGLREQAKEAQPSSGVNWLLLANAYERAGHTAEARAAYAQALQLGGLPESARENARARLQALPTRPAKPLD